MENRPIIRRWGIRIENYWRVFFPFSKKIRMRKRNKELLELLQFQVSPPPKKRNFLVLQMLDKFMFGQRASKHMRSKSRASKINNK